MNLERDGHGAVEAQRLLVYFEEQLAMHVADRDRLRNELAEIQTETLPKLGGSCCRWPPRRGRWLADFAVLKSARGGSDYRCTVVWGPLCVSLYLSLSWDRYAQHALGAENWSPWCRAQDRYMDCAEIADEVEANDQKVAGLVSEKGPKTTFSAMAFGMDWGTQDNEITALQSRQQYLVTLAEQRRCGVAALRMTLPADESSNDITPPASASALFPHSPR